MASPGTRGKLVGVVLVEAEYITRLQQLFYLDFVCNNKLPLNAWGFSLYVTHCRLNTSKR